MPIQIEEVVKEEETAVNFLARQSGLSKLKIKDAMQKGACFISQGRKTRRLRRAKAILKPGQTIALYYDEDILAAKAPEAILLQDLQDYSLWYKPAGVLSQGSKFGDHCAISRQAELSLKREVFLVQRLDREASGLMLLAHTRSGAAGLSKLFQDQQIEKHYRVRVKGVPPAEGTIDAPLDGKEAHTRFRLISQQVSSATLEVSIRGGRLHQIRRHLASINHPVLGDPRYGQNNSCPDGLQLVASGLKFKCPLNGQRRNFALDNYII